MTKEQNYYIDYIERYLDAKNLKAAKKGVEELLIHIQKELNTPKSGDKYEHIISGGSNKVIYTLQKLPDFDAWILIRDTSMGITYWTGPSPLDDCGIEDMTKIS